jgi:hypothetical protein
MSTVNVNPQPGDLGFATIAGMVGGWVNIGQALVHDACRFDHVYAVVHPVGHPNFADGLIVEAMPSGARFRTLADRLGPGFAYATVPLTDVQRAMVPAIAQGFVAARGGKGIGYSFGTYVAIGLAQYEVTRWVTPGLERIIDDKGRLICSQLCDELLLRVGYHCFTDGRWRGDCTPGDLWYRFDPRVIQPAPASVVGA